MLCVHPLRQVRPAVLRRAGEAGGLLRVLRHPERRWRGALRPLRQAAAIAARRKARAGGALAPRSAPGRRRLGRPTRQVASTGGAPRRLAADVLRKTPPCAQIGTVLHSLPGCDEGAFGRLLAKGQVSGVRIGATACKAVAKHHAKSAKPSQFADGPRFPKVLGGRATPNCRPPPPGAAARTEPRTLQRFSCGKGAKPPNGEPRRSGA